MYLLELYFEVGMTTDGLSRLGNIEPIQEVGLLDVEGFPRLIGHQAFTSHSAT